MTAQSRNIRTCTNWPPAALADARPSGLEIWPELMGAPLSGPALVPEGRAPSSSSTTALLAGGARRGRGALLLWLPGVEDRCSLLGFQIASVGQMMHSLQGVAQKMHGEGAFRWHRRYMVMVHILVPLLANIWCKILASRTVHGEGAFGCHDRHGVLWYHRRCICSREYLAGSIVEVHKTHGVHFGVTEDAWWCRLSRSTDASHSQGAVVLDTVREHYPELKYRIREEHCSHTAQEYVRLKRRECKE
eukprot:1157496-Pelagomonas_calceolata.AAC.5